VTLLTVAQILVALTGIVSGGSLIAAVRAYRDARESRRDSDRSRQPTSSVQLTETMVVRLPSAPADIQPQSGATNPMSGRVLTPTT
jgi:hypothetical protein